MENAAQKISEILVFWGMTPSGADGLNKLVVFVFVLFIAYLADAICRHVVLPLITKLVQKTKITWDDVVFDKKVMIHLTHIVPPLIIYICMPFVFPDNPDVSEIIQRICKAFGVFFFVCFINALLIAIYRIYTEKESYRDRPLKGLLQTLQVILFIVGAIGIISILINESLVGLFAGLGAFAAVLMLVFKDSIMGFVSGIQLSVNNMLRVGDWITMPKYGADGSVIEVTLNTVKIRNWDNTITTIPPYLLISDSFQNWRGMQESGGRRVKRSINIDMNTVRFCTSDMLNKYRKIHFLKDYIEETEQIIDEHNERNKIDNSILVNGWRQTNLGIFRAYLNNYLKNHPQVNHDMTYMVRHLHPTEKGIPIELYFFSSTTNWILYENIQADMFDHLLAIIPEFDLRVFQHTSAFNARSSEI
ncbi:Miniconductance mechanosensitive channel YbdG [termite gut metagenome]|uniref:Miniconductance mechanosensitive channel YbdG n=1 Tax=termite gut metagenome TaxID=433724 RepID=A0A5J4SH07_9ZZZZ